MTGNAEGGAGLSTLFECPYCGKPLKPTTHPSGELKADVADLVADAAEPFLIPDVTPKGMSSAAVFHIVRDMVDDGELIHAGDGYWREERP